MINDPHPSIYLLAEEYYRFALEEKEEYLAVLRNVAEKTRTIYPDDAELTCVKTIESLMRKLESKGISYKITDALRFTLLIKFPNEKDGILACLNGYGYRVWTNPKTGREDITNRFLDPMPGYKDIAIKLVKSEADSIVKELQLLQSAMYKAKQEKGHDIYDQIKSLDLQREATISQVKDLAALEKELAEIDEDRRSYESLSNALYQQAFEQDNPEGIGNPNLS